MNGLWVVAAEIIIEIALRLPYGARVREWAVRMTISNDVQHCWSAARAALDRLCNDEDPRTNNGAIGFRKVRQNQPGIIRTATGMRQLHFCKCQYVAVIINGISGVDDC